MGGHTGASGSIGRKSFGEKFDLMLRVKGLKQNSVATRLGLHASKLVRWVKGEAEPSFPELRAVSEILGVDFNYLCDPVIPADAWERHRVGIQDSRSPQEVVLAGIVERIGVEEAIRRLVAAVPETTTAPPAAVKAAGGSQLDPAKLETPDQPAEKPGRGQKPKGSDKKSLGDDRAIGKGKG